MLSPLLAMMVVSCIGGMGGVGSARRAGGIVGNGDCFGGFSNGGICAMEANMAGDQFVQPLLVFIGEMETKLGEHFVGSRADVPHVAHYGEEASQFKKKKGEVLDGGIREQFASSSGNVLDLMESIPKHFDGVSGGPEDGMMI